MSRRKASKRAEPAIDPYDHSRADKWGYMDNVGSGWSYILVSCGHETAVLAPGNLCYRATTASVRCPCRWLCHSPESPD
jgi:hypothetical protein